MLPTDDPLELYRGDTVRLVRYLSAPDTDPAEFYDLTGSTPTAQIRTSTTASVLYEFDCELTDQTTDPGGIVMTLEAGTTDDAPSKGKWDWQLEFADGSVLTFGAGTVKFSGQITKPVA